MKGLLKLLLFAVVMLASCKPDLYTGPLDAPCGNWRGVHTEYRFNGAEVSVADTCIYGVISFYRQGLCCIEGHKGAVAYSYDSGTSVLEVGTDVWKANVLTGAEMVLQFVEDSAPADVPEGDAGEGSSTEPGGDAWDGVGTEPGGDAEDMAGGGPGDVGLGGSAISESGIVFPVEFMGLTIVSDRGRYYYTDKDGKRVRCYYIEEIGPDGNANVRFWYDTHIDSFIPYN